MKHPFLVLLILSLALASACGQKTYDNQWKEVESLTRKNLPQSALKIVDSIYLQAKSENNAPQFLKAALYQMKLRSDYQEDFMENILAQNNEELKTAKEPVSQILHTIQAELYWRYYQGNRYRFMNRTRVTNPNPDDIKTWDLQTLVEQVTENYLSSLKDPGQLQKIRLERYDPILDTSRGSKTFRPTLYDFLAHRALDFFMNEEPAVTKPAASFILDKPEYFAPAAEFVKISLPTSANDDMKWHALAVFNELIRFHLKDPSPAALIDDDLDRLEFVKQNAVMPDADQLYLNALLDLQTKYAGDPASANVSYRVAQEYINRGKAYNPPVTDTNRWDVKQAKEVCDTTIGKFPGTDGAHNCASLVQQITASVLNFTVDYANLPNRAFLGSLNFKNVQNVYFRIIKFDPEDDMALRRKERGENIIAKYKTVSPVKEWSFKLPEQGDFQAHSAEIKLPPLSKGYYIILVSDNRGFSFEDQTVAYAPCWITNISYISKRNTVDGSQEIYVLDRDKGTALKGVSAQAYMREYDYQSRSYKNKPVSSYKTDESGFFSIPGQTNLSKSFYLEFTLNDDYFYTENYFYITPPREEAPARVTTYFFTDRSIYRPGQTVYFKGIVLEKTGSKSVIKPDFTTVVGFYDANGQKVSELAMTTNDFGSFNGAFTAPSGGLTGNMYIRNESGSTGFSVEEYKRPRFRVEMDPLEGSYKLDKEVIVTGKAVTYNGSAVDQAGVSYRVVRTARFPVWRSWWHWFPSVPETEIISGNTTTDADGKFSFTFPAIPDRQVPKKFQPVFNYQVYVDVTDLSGEVRSANEMVSVGYQSMLLDIDLPDQLNLTDKNKFDLSVTNLNHQPVNAEGKITVYPLVAPDRVIRDRRWPRPDVFLMSREDFLKDFPDDLYNNENDPETWKKKAAVYDQAFNTATDSVVTFDNLTGWVQGQYLVVMEATDTSGDKMEIKKYFTAFDPSEKEMPVWSAFYNVMINDKGEPGDTASLLVGSAEKNAKILYEIENNGKIISRQWLSLSQEKKMLPIPVVEAYRGDFYVNLVMIKGNRSYEATKKITVPYNNKKLKITTETFRDQLTPGQQEEWRLHIAGMNGDKVAAELLASMYDASLDAFREHNWVFDLYTYRSASGGWETSTAFSQSNSREVFKNTQPVISPIVQEYDRLNWFGFNYYGAPVPMRTGGIKGLMRNAEPAMDGGLKEKELADESQQQATPPTTEEEVPPPAKEPDIPVRRNFEETAFFFPDLRTDDKGDVILKFTVPESLTAWKFMALAYTKDLKTGQLEKEVVTRKDLMVMSNAPRFFREDDQMLFAARLVSLTDKPLRGKITAEFFNAYTMQPIDTLMGNLAPGKSFSVEKGKSGVYFWEIAIPHGVEAIACRVKASAGEFTDGEEIVVPVLPNRMLVTETMPIAMNGKGSKNFKFSKLNDSFKSTTIKNYRLTLEFTSNPAWYAVQALPYLQDNPNASADGVFERYYANSMASYIANSNPKIKQVFESWKNITPDAFLSSLEKNQELKAVVLEETPWVMEARNETERKKRVALLFDLNRMAGEQQAALAKLQKLQSPNGGWSWFEGMPDNRYITQLIETGFGRLQHLQVIDLKKDPQSMNMVRMAFNYLSQRISEDYEKIKTYDKDKMEDNHLGPVQVQYLYAYSYLKDYLQVPAECRDAFDYYKGQAEKYWTGQNKYIQGMIAIALYRLEVAEVPADIIHSLKENALESDEMGMYWRDNEGYSWYEAPVERQAMLIETFTEVANDQASVELMKIWLLKQKQTQDWRTSRATADAVYAILLKGTDLLASNQLVEVTMGGEKIDPLAMDGVEVQAGTGYFEVSRTGNEIQPDAGNVKVVKKDEGIAWGAVYWQYFENLDKITPAATPLSIEKDLYVERNTPSGPVLDPVFDNSIMKTGDKLKVRITIRTDRDMEYVHMKDMRAAAFEPVESLSGYRYQDGLGYYESIRDASMNFFFDYLRKGTYVFEYEMNVTQKGEFSNGITSIQCLYAPEFAAHSQGKRVKVE